MSFESSYAAHDQLILPSKLVDELRATEIAERSARTEYLARQRQQEEEEQCKTEPSWSNPLANYVGPVLQIFDKDDVTSHVKNLDATSTDNDHRRRAKALIKMLETKGEFRMLATIPWQWRRDLDQMEEAFPNFAEVLDHVRVSCALAAQSDHVVRLCILLSGPAGTGKSLFSQVLAQWLRGGYVCVRFETAQSSSDLAGSSTFWSNTKAGKPFTQLTEQEYGNPTFFLDEIDKCSADRYDPLGPLYSLLEPGTAREHVDLSWPFLRLDCSKINYIAACNNPDLVPAPLLSRMRRFDIQAPIGEQSVAIVKNIIKEESRRATDVRFSDGAIDALCQLSPRRMRQMVQEALGRALYHERDVVEASDVTREQKRPRMGFLP